MRRRSKKTDALYRKWGPERAEYLKTHATCHICRQSRSTGVHEILSGPYRLRSFAEPATWLATCSQCNCIDLTDRTLWPVARQLSRKLQFDRDNFDLDKVNAIWSPRKVTLEEVIAYAEEVRP